MTAMTMSRTTSPAPADFALPEPADDPPYELAPPDDPLYEFEPTDENPRLSCCSDR